MFFYFIKKGLTMNNNQNFIKPQAPIIGADGNIFNLIAIASRSLKNEGHYELAKEMSSRVTSSQSYEEALSIICEYVDPVDQNYVNDLEHTGMDYE